jgi:hypothetical protein
VYPQQYFYVLRSRFSDTTKPLYDYGKILNELAGHESTAGLFSKAARSSDFDH